MKRDDLLNEDHEATYCPEDDKLRLYVGRVPRDEYEALRAEGWTSTPKQDCDFVATWTADREDTALSYAGEIGDEDQSPQDRAADRAERFSEYRDRRTGEALTHADTYDSGPAAHGYQSKAKAARAADRHDRQADRALTQWDKAEYWTRRTSGVIQNALHKSRPDVRMGRIKKLESELRKAEKSWTESTQRAQTRFDALLSVVEHAEGTREKVRPMGRQDFLWSLSSVRENDGTPEDAPATPEQIRRAVVSSCLDHYGMSEVARNLATEAAKGTRPAADIARDYLAANPRPDDWDPEEGTRYTRHLRLRLAYENQMLEAQGGRASTVEMEKGGTWQGATIAKIAKSNATGRVVSVQVIVPRVEGWHYQVNNQPGTPYALAKFKTERGKPGDYQPPTPESLAKLAEFEEARKAATKKAPKAPPLVNPTLADAERLQALLNDEAEGCPWRQRNPGPASEVACMTMAEYKAISGGSYGTGRTEEISAMGKVPERSNLYSTAKEKRNAAMGPVLCKVRTRGVSGYGARRVVHITDKPTKPLPAAVWQPYEAPATPEQVEA